MRLRAVRGTITEEMRKQDTYDSISELCTWFCIIIMLRSVVLLSFTLQESRPSRF